MKHFKRVFTLALLASALSVVAVPVMADGDMEEEICTDSGCWFPN